MRDWLHESQHQMILRWDKLALLLDSLSRNTVSIVVPGISPITYNLVTTVRHFFSHNSNLMMKTISFEKSNVCTYLLGNKCGPGILRHPVAIFFYDIDPVNFMFDLVVNPFPITDTNII